MLRLRDGQSTLWEALLPEEARLLSPELTTIDELLDDACFLQPFVDRFSCPIGRPTIPMETYLRLMYLKHRYSLGYETLVKEVADSLSWRRFCRIQLDGRVPHSTTLVKLTRRFGEGIVDDLNKALLKAAVERKVLRSRRLRVDTTVVEADVRYPTDTGLCAHAIGRLGRAVRKVKQAGLATRTRFHDRGRGAGKIVRKVSHSLGRKGAKPAVEQFTGELHKLVGKTAAEAVLVLRNAKRSLRGASKTGQVFVTRLTCEIEKAQRVIVQTARRLAGETTIADRMISLSDVDARPIRRGKPQRSTEFGYKVSVADSVEGFVVSHQVYVGATADAQTLRAAVVGALSTGMRVDTVLGDRGYGDAVGDEALRGLPIKDKVIPRKGHADPIQLTRSWRRRYRHRNGCEGRISHLKRRHGWSRSRLKGHSGATIWVGYGVLAHNLDKMRARG